LVVAVVDADVGTKEVEEQKARSLLAEVVGMYHQGRELGSSAK
jgi:hypothetical protein